MHRASLRKSVLGNARPRLPKGNLSISSMILSVWEKWTGEQQGAGFEEQEWICQ